MLGGVNRVGQLAGGVVAVKLRRARFARHAGAPAVVIVHVGLRGVGRAARRLPGDGLQAVQRVAMGAGIHQDLISPECVPPGLWVMP